MKMTINDVENKETVLIIRIPDSKNGMERIFTVLNPNNSINYLSYIIKYMTLRPPNIESSRLFLKYAQNKCSKQPVGINTFGKMPSVIAEYLKLPNPTCYTGHSFRRSSATMLANSGGDLITVKKHGGWKSSAVAEGYIDSTLSKKIDISNKILTNDASSSNSTSTFDNIPEIEISNITSNMSSEVSTNINKLTDTPFTSSSNVACNSRRVDCEDSQVNSRLKSQGLTFNNSNSCTFNIHIVHN